MLRGARPGFIYGIMCVILFFLSGRVAMADMKVWYCRDGQAVVGEFERTGLGKIFVRGADRRIISIELSNLVAADLNYLYAKIPPELDVAFKTRAVSVEVGPDARQDDIYGITATVRLEKTSKLPFKGALSGRLYLIGKEVATDHYRLFAKKAFAVSFPDPEDNLFEVKKYAEIKTYDEYDGRERGARYAGYVVAIYGVDGSLMNLKTNLSWIEEEQLGLLEKMTVPAFFYEDCKERSVPRPSAETREYKDTIQ